MSRMFDHKKQYVCTEVFWLEELQEAVAELEDYVDEDTDRFLKANIRLFALSNSVKEAIEKINEFIKNLKEQERGT